MAIKPGSKQWKTKKEMGGVGGEKGKLHRELGVPEGEKIPAGKLEAATHSSNPEIKRDAIRAETMKKWNHGGSKRRETLYDHPRSRRLRNG